MFLFPFPQNEAIRLDAAINLFFLSLIWYLADYLVSIWRYTMMIWSDYVYLQDVIFPTFVLFRYNI